VQRVWTTDGNGNNKTTFAPGDAIQYWVQVNNASGSPIQGLFQYEAFLGKVNSFSTQIYDHIFQNIPVPVGAKSHNAASTVPSNAQLGAYTIRVHVAAQGSSNGA